MLLCQKWWNYHVTVGSSRAPVAVDYIEVTLFNFGRFIIPKIAADRCRVSISDPSWKPDTLKDNLHNQSVSSVNTAMNAAGEKSTSISQYSRCTHVANINEKLEQLQFEQHVGPDMSDTRPYMS